MLKLFFLFFFCCIFCLGSRLEAGSILVPGALSHENRLFPKQSLQGSIPIQNDGDTPVKVKVSLADYLFNHKGESSFLPVGNCSRSNAKWLDASKMTFEIAPHTTYSFTYTIKIPDDPALQGTYWSIFLIEPAEEPFDAPEKEKSLGIQTVIRYGVQIITHVGGEGKYDLKILGKQLVKEAEKKTFSLQVDNTGSLSLSPVLILELMNATGKKVQRFETPKQRILPSCSVSYQVDLSCIPSGTYKAMAILDHGEGALFGAQYDLVMD